jgi:hypothetical protein
MFDYLSGSPIKAQVLEYRDYVLAGQPPSTAEVIMSKFEFKILSKILIYQCPISKSKSKMYNKNQSISIYVSRAI